MWGKLKKLLVDNWCLAWRWWSMRFNALGLLILGYVQFDPVGALGVWNMMPHPVKSVLPQNFVAIAGMTLFALSMLARIVKQPKLHA
jgi:hypothetical protein